MRTSDLGMGKLLAVVLLAAIAASLPLLFAGCVRSAKIRPLAPTAVIVAFGDSRTDAAPEAIVGNLDAMICFASPAGAEVLLVSVPQKGLVLTSAAPVYRCFAAGRIGAFEPIPNPLILPWLA